MGCNVSGVDIAIGGEGRGSVDLERHIGDQADIGAYTRRGQIDTGAGIVVAHVAQIGEGARVDRTVTPACPPEGIVAALWATA